LKTKRHWQKTNRNEPKNEAEKLLKTRSCGKNEAKNEAGHIVENKGLRKNVSKTNRRNSSLNVACLRPSLHGLFGRRTAASPRQTMFLAGCEHLSESARIHLK